MLCLCGFELYPRWVPLFILSFISRFSLRAQEKLFNNIRRDVIV